MRKIFVTFKTNKELPNKQKLDNRKRGLNRQFTKLIIQMIINMKVSNFINKQGKAN